MLFWRNRHEVQDKELNAFVDGELAESARLRVERHLEACATCSETIAELRAVSRAMSELPAVRAPRSFALREADVSPAPANGGTGLFGSVTPLLSGVAAIAIVAFVVLVGVDVTDDTGDFSAQTSNRLALDSSEDASLAPERANGTSTQFEYRGDEYSAGDGGAQGVEDGVPPQDWDDSTGDDELSELDPNLPAVGDSEPRLGTEPGVLPDESEDEVATGELDQTFSGSSIAPAPAGDDGGSTGLRVAESVAAAVAIAAGGSVFLIWWRRRTTVG